MQQIKPYKPKYNNKKKVNPNTKPLKKINKKNNNNVKKITNKKTNNVIAPIYKLSLLYPELKLNAKIPSMFSLNVIPYHREIILSPTTDANGNGGIMFCPQFLNDSTDQLTRSQCLYTGMTNSDGIAAGVYGNSYIAQKINHTLQATTAFSYRLVSCSMTVRTNTALANNSGVITFGVANCKAYPVVNPATAAANTDIALFLAQTNILQYPISDMAYLSKGDGARMIWLPNDSCDYEMVPTNTAYSTYNANDTLSYFIVRVEGCSGLTGPVQTQLTIKINANWEIIPVQGTNWAGSESYCRETSDPQRILREIKSNKNNSVQHRLD